MEVLDERTNCVISETKSGMGRDEYLEQTISRFLDRLIQEFQDELHPLHLHSLDIGRIIWDEGDSCKASKSMTLEQFLQLKRIIQLILLLEILLNGSELKVYIRLERGGSCCAIVLLSNKGAHAYYGNGICLTKCRRGDDHLPLITHEEMEDIAEDNRSLHDDHNVTYADASTQYELDEFADTSNLPVDILQREPSDQELCTMGLNIGPEFRRLGLMLGLTDTALYHIERDNRDECEQKNIAMLFKWRKSRENNATFDEIRKACILAKINPGKILEVSCKNGYYGKQCGSKCGACQDLGKCDSETGICISGCASGYTGPLCNSRNETEPRISKSNSVGSNIKQTDGTNPGMIALYSILSILAVGIGGGVTFYCHCRKGNSDEDLYANINEFERQTNPPGAIEMKNYIPNGKNITINNNIYTVLPGART